MKTFFSIIALSLFLFLTSCCDADKKTSTFDCAKDKVAIENLLENYILANENENFDLIEDIWSSANDIILYGTSSDERLVGWPDIKNAIKVQFGQIEETYISSYDQSIKFNCTGNTAWFAENLNYNYMYKGEAYNYEGLRFTGVVEKIEGKWKIVQAHLSVPASASVGE